MTLAIRNVSLRVLLVEDDLVDQKVLLRVLKKLGTQVEVSTATTVEEAKAAIRHGLFDVVLVDYWLPGGTALDVVRALESTIPAIVLTGQNDEAKQMEVLRDGAEDYLLKGAFDTDLLMRTIVHALERHQIKRELAAANRRLSELVRVDPLTGLLNRRGLEEELKREGERSRRQGSSMVVMLLDLDSFKQINDTFGYSTGDAVLHQVGATLRRVLRDVDHIARIGGDEFLVILPDTRRGEGMLVTERVRKQISTIVIEHDRDAVVRVTASIGLLSLSESLTLDDILKRIHTALHRSKMLGKDKVSVVADHDVMAVNDGNMSDANLWAACQSVLRLSDHEKVGYEFLIRGTSGGLNLPQALLQLSLDRKELSYLDQLCFQTCVRAAAPVRQNLRCHVNLFPSTLLGTPTEELMETLNTSGARASWCVEISEQLFSGDPNALLGRVQALQAAGVSIAIDDVGYGRSSMEALIVLQPQVIKIDRRYVTGLGDDIGKRNSLKRLVAVSKALGAETVAEGIETAEDLRIATEMGCDAGQGYFWGMPGKLTHD